MKRRSRHYSLKNRIPGLNRDVQYAAADTQRILHITNEFYSAVATFERKDAIWRCIQADTAVEWLKQTPFDHVKTELLKRGCSWEWLPVSGSAASGLPGHKHESFTITSRTAARPDSYPTGHSQASISATGGTQGMEKLLDQGQQTTCPNSKCSAVPTT